MFLVVPAHPGSSGQRAVKHLCLFADVKRLLKKTIADSVHTPASRLCEEQAIIDCKLLRYQYGDECRRSRRKIKLPVTDSYSEEESEKGVHFGHYIDRKI